MMKSLRILTLVLVAASVFGSCAKELTDLPENTSGSDAISFGMDGSFWAKVQTKAAEVTSLSSFYVTAVTGSAGSESQVWNSVQFNQVPGSSPATYVGDQSWPLSDPGYKFYGSNVGLNFAVGGTYVNASNATDVVCAYLSSPTYKTKNTLTFEHIFARLCRVDVAAQTGYTVSNISMYITPKTGGTYNLRTGAGHTDGTGWSSVTSGSATLISDKTGATDNDIYMVPGNYAITCTWTATDASGASVTHTNEASTLPIKGGATNNISVVLGGDIMLGVDLQDYCEYDYRDNLDYLTFYCDEAGTIGWKCSNASIARTIQYSKDFGATWTDLTSTTSGAAVAVNAGDIVWFKGSNTEYANTYYYNQFTLSNKAHVYGNVNSLTGNNSSVSDYCFYHLFNNCSNLYTYPSKKIILPATTLGVSCYSYMFQNCSNLTDTPELPATTLANDCYCYMFYGCTSLVVAPELPATTLALRCYREMFSMCIHLENAPELPATSMERQCYYKMFQDCFSLVVAPKLPATNLQDECYYGMFHGCLKLVVAPELPSLTLPQNCYNSMFYNCSSLRYIKALFTSTPGNYYTSSWVNGVAGKGVFVKNAAATWEDVGYNGVPTGWVVETQKIPMPIGSFTINSNGDQVAFSWGNLWAHIASGPTDSYNFAADEWGFFENQWEISTSNLGVGNTVSLFRWVGASANYDTYGLCNSNNSSSYYGSSTSDALKTDWGSIPGVIASCGGGWSMLSSTEWEYILVSRTTGGSVAGTSDARYTMATIRTDVSSGVRGMIVFPDDVDFLGSEFSTVGTLNEASGWTTSCTSAQWDALEAKGCVFLPVSESISGGGSLYVTNNHGSYWSSTSGSSQARYAYHMFFYSNGSSSYFYPSTDGFRYDGSAVRLVKRL